MQSQMNTTIFTSFLFPAGIADGPSSVLSRLT